MFPAQEIEDMDRGHLEEEITKRDFHKNSTDRLYRLHYRIIRLAREPQTNSDGSAGNPDWILRYAAIIEREIDRKNLRKTWTVSVVSAVVAITGAVVSFLPKKAPELRIRVLEMPDAGISQPKSQTPPPLRSSTEPIPTSHVPTDAGTQTISLPAMPTTPQPQTPTPKPASLPTPIPAKP